MFEKQSVGQLMLTVLGGLAEFERSLIVARTARAGHEHRRKALGSAGRGRSMRINGGKLLHAWTLAMPQPTWPARLAAIGRQSIACVRPPSDATPRRRGRPMIRQYIIAAI
jgi:hypothetical protein